MTGKKHTHEYIRGGCEAAKNARKFVEDWIATDKNPCSVCHNDKSSCHFYQEAIRGEDNEEREDQA
jgi:hypothetical protein